MKLVDIQRAAALRDERQSAISRHNWLEMFRKPHPFQHPSVSIQGVTFDGVWDEIAPVLLSHQRAIIERLEAELRDDFGIEVEPHFKTDADGWLKPTSPLADMLTARGYNLVGTGGNCKAWVKVTGDEEHIVISDLHGGSEPDINDWMVSRFRTEEWDDGHTQRSSDSERDFWSAVDHAEATPAYEG